jgi:hypothetical protein
VVAASVMITSMNGQAASLGLEWSVEDSVVELVLGIEFWMIEV